MIIFFSFHAKRFLSRSAKAADGCTCVRARVTDSDNPSKRVSTFTENIMQNLLTSLIYVYINAFLQSRHQYHLSAASWIMLPAPLRLSSLVSSYISIYLPRARDQFRRADVKSSSGWSHRRKRVSRKHTFRIISFACRAFCKMP